MVYFVRSAMNAKRQLAIESQLNFRWRVCVVISKLAVGREEWMFGIVFVEREAVYGIVRILIVINM